MLTGLGTKVTFPQPCSLATRSLYSSSCAGVTYDTVTMAKDEHGDIIVNMTDTNAPGPTSDHPVNWRVIADLFPETTGAVGTGDCYCPETKFPNATMHQAF